MAPKNNPNSSGIKSSILRGIEIGEKIGGGNYGDIYLAIWGKSKGSNNRLISNDSFSRL
jgi:hypothetical protein